VVGFNNERINIPAIKALKMPEIKNVNNYFLELAFVEISCSGSRKAQ